MDPSLESLRIEAVLDTNMLDTPPDAELNDLNELAASQSHFALKIKSADEIAKVNSRVLKPVIGGVFKAFL